MIKRRIPRVGELTPHHAGSCTELGTDPATWSRTGPLPKPISTLEAIETFERSYRALPLLISLEL
jgi:hypothetical protein